MNEWQIQQIQISNRKRNADLLWWNSVMIHRQFAEVFVYFEKFKSNFKVEKANVCTCILIGDNGTALIQNSI